MRTTEQMATDIGIARIFEDDIARQLERLNLPAVITNFSAKDKPDIELPGLGVYIELKLKNQALGDKWVKHITWASEDAFIIDEVSLRKMVQFSPAVWFLLRDVPLDRLFLASVHELVSVERVRLDRNNRGKLIFNLGHFRQVPDVSAALVEIEKDATTEMFRQPWPVGLLNVRKV